MSAWDIHEAELEALERRIGRLALLCEANISNPEVVVGLLRKQFDVCGRKDGLDSVHLEELRALLMLRYRIEAQCLDEMDPTSCLQHIDALHDRMRKLGLPTLSE